MKGKRGITLVSLVVTIIVLIILAGVSINLTLGENGIITMAKRARENMELAKIDEERQLNELYEQIVTEGGSLGNESDDEMIRLAQFKKEIASAITDMGIETEASADATTMSSNIRSLGGASSADKVTYDNTNSGLSATNVQGAVDELNDSLYNNRFIFSIRQYGNESAYSGSLGFTREGFSYSNIAYRNSINSPYIDDLRIKATIPHAAEGGTLTIEFVGTHKITIEKNTLDIAIPTQFTDEITLSGWKKDGTIICKID